MIKYIDPFLEENTSSFCDFFERLDKKMLVSLTNCKLTIYKSSDF